MTAPRVALTFDAEHPDRPHRPGGTSRVLDVLAAAEVTATFFLQGRWVEAYPDLARRVAEEGHLIGNHSFYHAPMPGFSGAGLAADVRGAEAVIRSVTGRDPKPWFRCPFGAGTTDPAVLAGLDALGYLEVRWHIEGDDWKPATDGIEMARSVATAALGHGDGAVILLHPWTMACEDGLPTLIDRLRAGGATFTTVDALAVLPDPAPGHG